jgi:hypothetical protein
MTKPTKPKEKTFTVPALAKICGVSAQKIRNDIKDGLLIAYLPSDLRRGTLVPWLELSDVFEHGYVRAMRLRREDRDRAKSKSKK